MTSYQVTQLDLSVPRSAVVIDGTKGAPVATVWVIQLPAGQTPSLHIGAATQNPIPLNNQGVSFDICPAETGGIFITNTLGAGILILLISFDEGTVSVGGSA
jgi:hypothetical protein